MAGNYPDVPGQWMAYDRDGSAAFWTDGAASVSQIPDLSLPALNDQLVSATGLFYGYIGVVFPEVRDIAGINYQQGSNTPIFTAQTSVDTTNGLDGTWVTRSTSLNNSGGSMSINRSQSRTINAVNWAAVVSVRCRTNSIGGDTTVPGLHIYGAVDPLASPNRMRIWHPTLDEPIDLNDDGAYFDWGNTPRGSSADRTFRVKNQSASLTANNIIVSCEALTDDGTTPFAGQLSVSDDGSTFSSQITITALAPGAISGVLTLRRVTPSNAALGVWWARLVAAPNSWT